MGYNAKYTFSALTIFEEIHKHNSNILHLNLSYFVTAPLQAPISICCFILVCGIMSHSFFFVRLTMAMMKIMVFQNCNYLEPRNTC